MVEYYLNLDHTRDAHRTLKQTSLAISRAAINLMAPAELGAPYLDSGVFGTSKLVEELVEKEGIDVNTGSDVFRKPLFSAAYNGYSEIAQYLLSRGAKADSNELEYFELNEEELRDWEKRSVWPSGEQVQFPRPNTALEAAALRVDENMIQLLLFHPGTKLSRTSYSYLRAIEDAARSGNIELLKLLHGEGAMSKNVIQTLWNHTLLSAAYHGKKESVSYLLNMGAELDYVWYWERYFVDTTALGFAAMRDHNDTVQLLLDRGADINGASGGCNSEEAPLLLASEYEFPQTVTLLLDKGASMPPMETQVLFRAAFCYSPVDCIRVFLEKGFHKRSPDGGKAALRAAVADGRQEVVALSKTFRVTLDEE